MNRHQLTSTLAALFVTVSCSSKQEKMGKGFQLPAGDVERGKTAFVQLGCTRCHDVSGADLAPAAGISATHFKLGGEVRKVKTYGELVTAIIQPQHVVSSEYLETLEGEKPADAVSPMPDFNDKMTVRQLTDIVTFLHEHYRQVVPEGMNTPYYAP